MARNFTGIITDQIALDASFGIVPPLSFSAWVKPGASDAVRTIISGLVNSIQFRIETDERLGFIKTTAANIGQSTGTVTNGVWQQVGGSYDGTNFVFYINGVSAGSGSNAQTISSTTMKFGINAQSNNEFFLGDMAEFAAWTVVLTAGEFASLGKGWSPRMIRLPSLREHISLVRNVQSLRFAAPTVSGTTVVAHSLVIMPRGRKMNWLEAAAAAPVYGQTLAMTMCDSMSGRGNPMGY